jgi:hypothetical protein
VSLEATLTQIVIDGSKNPFTFFTPKGTQPFFFRMASLQRGKKSIDAKLTSIMSGRFPNRHKTQHRCESFA